MTEYDNTNRGALFPNDKKGNNKAPAYKGNVNVNGEDYDVAAWEKTSKAGKQYLSLSISVKGERSEQPAPQANTDMDSEIPF